MRLKHGEIPNEAIKEPELIKILVTLKRILIRLEGNTHAGK
jgi:hypothetical protein